MSGLLLPTFQILYGQSQQDITAAVGESWKEALFEESIGGKACYVRMTFADGARMFQGDTPAKGSPLSLSIGYLGQTLTRAGTFEVDGYEVEGPPSLFILDAIEAGMSEGLRSLNSVAYENQTLTQIARTIADKYGFTMSGQAVEPDVQYARLTQNMESDLAFLHRLANMHGYEFNIRNKNLVFYSRTAIEAQASVGTIDHFGGTVKRYRLKDQSLGHKIVKQANLGHLVPSTKTFAAATAAGGPPEAGNQINAAQRVENEQQAQLIADSYLHAHNMLGQTGELTILGTMQYRAGDVIRVRNFGVFDQYGWIVERAHHTLNRQGYLTRLHVRTQLKPGKPALGGLIPASGRFTPAP